MGGIIGLGGGLVGTLHLKHRGKQGVLTRDPIDLLIKVVDIESDRGVDQKGAHYGHQRHDQQHHDHDQLHMQAAEQGKTSFPEE